MFEHRYRQLVRFSAIYDLAATAAFATPWTFQLVHQALGLISPLPDFQPLHVFFANMLGSIVVVWSILRIWRPEPILGLFDSFARGMFFFWQIYYLLVYGISPVVWVFAALEFAFGASQAYGYWLLHKVRSGAPARCRIVSHYAQANS